MRRLVFFALGTLACLCGVGGHTVALALSLVVSFGLCRHQRQRLVPGIWGMAGVASALVALHCGSPSRGPVEESGAVVGRMEVESSSRVGLDSTTWRGSLEGLRGTSHCAVRERLGDLRAGETYLVRGRARPLRPGANPHAFDFAAYLARRGVVRRVTVDDYVLVAGGDGLTRAAAGLRSAWHQRVRQVVALTNLGTPASGMLHALLSGAQRRLPRPTRELLSTSGLAHLVAISGLHLGCFVWLVELLVLAIALGLRLPQAHKIGAATGIVAATWFLIVSGAPLSAVRAYIMLLGFGVARVTDRDYDIWTWLAAASLLVLTVRPAALEEAGFQLSTLAVAGITVVMGSTAGQAVMRQGELRRYAGTLALASVGAFVGTLGPAWWHFGVVAWVGLVLNVLVVPIVSLWILPLGLLGAAVATSWTDVSYLLINLAGAWLESLLLIAESIPRWAYWPHRPWPGLAIVAAAAGGLLVALTRGRRRDALLWAAAGLVTLWLPGIPSDTDGFRLTFLSVGDGDAAWLALPNGEHWLVDGGGPGEGRDVLAPLVEREGIERIERVFVTHGHADHYGGLLELPAALRICEVWTNGSPRLASVGATLQRRHCGCNGEDHPRVAHAMRGMSVDEAGVKLDVLWPALDLTEATENDRSLVLRVEHRHLTFLMTGDLEGRTGGLRGVDVEEQWQADVIKVPHHGRPSPFFRALTMGFSPIAFIVSRGGRAHGREAVGPAYETGRQSWWWSTAEEGAVTFFHDAKGWGMHFFRSGFTFRGSP